MSNEFKKARKGAHPSDNTAWKDVEFTSIIFPAQRKKVYRATIQLRDKATLTIEDKKTHEKWSCLIENASQHGPDMSIPQQAFIAAIESALEQLDSARTIPFPVARGQNAKAAAVTAAKEAEAANAKKEAGSVVADMSPVADCMNLTLQMHVSKIWVPEYTFLLKKVALAQMDLLVAQLRDLQEDKQWRSKSLMTLSNGPSRTGAATGTLLHLAQWNGDNNNKYDTDMYTLTEDNCAIIVHRAGFYHIYFSLDFDRASSTSYKSHLLVNGQKIASVRQSSNHIPFSQMQHIVSLEAGDEIKVHDEHGFTNRAVENNMNRFHMYLIN